ncbi:MULTISPECIES: chemotaxis protein [unclassified Methylobacterium]|uniref:chemotaxis protein n=1 Tax=unclassified Methylobacterium TaxID=2615210 RepID=UPI0006FC0B63|nr:MULTISPECIES: chemotaxis protein [unclassified Methylobacterium]KQO54294.1 chemotaxis protein [Methylobacterium sp. Leaf86]KQO90269.1 chemotaxis protein [Methylobacterium sp. Leaf91]
MNMKRYRIEDSLGLASVRPVVEVAHAKERSGSDDVKLDEILSAIQELRRVTQTSTVETIEACRKELNEAFAMRSELDVMKDAITRTKKEIATLYHSENTGKGMKRVAGELDAVVESTELATSTILGALEEIETNASALRAMRQAAGGENIDMILERVIVAYEACNFQDLTGQRINKIVGVLKFIEEHLDRMIEAWGGLNSFSEILGVVPQGPSIDDESSLLNGPKLDSDPGHVDQGDIDALFD